MASLIWLAVWPHMATVHPSSAETFNQRCVDQNCCALVREAMAVNSIASTRIRRLRQRRGTPYVDDAKVYRVAYCSTSLPSTAYQGPGTTYIPVPCPPGIAFRMSTFRIQQSRRPYRDRSDAGRPQRVRKQNAHPHSPPPLDIHPRSRELWEWSSHHKAVTRG